MSFTRFHDDPCRVKKQLQEMTGPGRYMINQPGWGDKPCYMEDPYMRIQQWGGNLRTNTINLESDLLGLTRPLGRDDQKEQDYKINEAPTEQISYGVEKPFTEESRASHPAWMYRDLEHPVWEQPIVDPQAHLEKPFHDNIQTRILEKDYYKPKVVPQLSCGNKDPFSIDYYLSKN